MEFIKGARDTAGCIFCDNLGPENKLLLYKGNISAVMLNKFPYNNAHLLIFPLRHTRDIEDLASEEYQNLFALIQQSVSILRSELNPDGFNIGLNLGRAAGAGVDGHIHFHIVPRWNGDNNFMPVISETKVMPEHLDSAYNKLKPYFDKL